MPRITINRDGADESHAYTEGCLEDATRALRYIVDALSDEPLFVIRGRDVLAVPVLAEYIRQCTHHGAYAQSGRATEHRRRFHDWQAENAKLTHMPDPIPSAGNGAN